jgi:hypothetical protein
MYLAYQNGVVLHCCSDLKIITDLLFIEQRKEFTIQPTDSSAFLAGCSTTDIFKIYLQLGGNSSLFKTAKEIIEQRQQLIQKCRELVLARKGIKYNGFEIEMQAAWVERKLAEGHKNCGYRYKQGSNIPVKMPV